MNRKAKILNIKPAPETTGHYMELEDGTIVGCSNKLPTPNVGDIAEVEKISGGRFRKIDHHVGTEKGES